MKLKTVKTVLLAGTGLALLAPGMASGAAISVNYELPWSSTLPLDPGDVAGVVPVDNWNNLATAGGVAPFNYGMTYLDNSGGNTSLTVTASVLNSYDSWNTLGTPDKRIFGDKALFGGSGTLTLSNVPYALYDLYIYPSDWGNEIINFSIGTNVQTLTNTFNPIHTSGAVFVLNDTYVRFTDLTGDSLVNMAAIAGEVHVAGFQVVEVPEPSILGLLALAPALAMRRRRA